MNGGFLIEKVLSIAFTLLSEEDLDSVSVLAFVIDSFKDLCTNPIAELSDHSVFLYHITFIADFLFLLSDYS